MNQHSQQTEEILRFFSYKDWTLFDAIDALCDCDCGATDSGVRDEAMKKAVEIFLLGLSYGQYRRICAVFARRYLSDEAIAKGYGVEDVVSFWEFARDSRFR